MPVCTKARARARQRCARIGRGRTARRTRGDRTAHESQKQSTTTARGPRFSDFPSAMSTNTSCATKNDPTTSASTTTRDVRMLSAAMSPTWDAGSARATGAPNHTGCAARPRGTTTYPRCVGVAETRLVPWCMSGALIASVLGLGMGLASPSVYNGRAGQLAVGIPRIDARIAIDGTLSDPVWERAALLNGFSEYKPVDGMPAEDSTEVLVWYSKNAIYFGIRAFEIHGPAHATLANRDQIDGDDNVQLILSPFLHSHQALMFAVNPYGVQEDGTITEGVGTTIGVTGISTGTGPDSTDLSSDFVYESKGQVTAFGYQVEVRIPFRSLKFPAKSPQDWGINVLRKVQHSGHSDTWYPAKLASSSYLDQAGTLVGIRDMDAGLVLDLNPIVTEQAVGNPTLGPAREWRYGVDRPQFGGNVRWGITSNLLLNGTYRPDFAEVESDATQIVSDPRNRTQYPEKRPFFLDGLEQFSAPNNLIYTRDIVAPIAATKISGKVGDVSLAYLGAIDEEDENGLFGGHPSFNILRAREDFAQGSEIGAVITDKEAGGSFNRLASVDSRVTFATLYTLNLQAAGSSTRDAGVSTAGPLWQAGLNRAGRSVFMNYQITGIDPEFNAGSGLISRGGITVANLDSRYTFYPTHSALETFAIDVTWGYTWVYRDFTSFGAPEDRQVHPSLIATFHGGWQIIYTLGLSTFGYDPS